MTNKVLKIIVTTAIAVIFGVAIYYGGIYKEPPYKTVELKQTNNLVYLADTSSNKYLDTLVRLGLEELGIDGVTVVVKPMTEDNDLMGSVELQASLASYGHNTYFLYIKDKSRRTSIEKVSHELIHLQQYNQGKLIISGPTVYWDGSIDLLENVMQQSYRSRPWEQEAFDKAPVLTKVLSTKLLK